MSDGTEEAIVLVFIVFVFFFLALVLFAIFSLIPLVYVCIKNRDVGNIIKDERLPYQNFAFDGVRLFTGNFASHTFFLYDNNWFGFGKNECGQLGMNKTEARSFGKIFHLPFKSEVVKISCGYDHTIALTKDSRIYSTGGNDYGQLAHGDEKNRNYFKEILFLRKKKKNSKRFRKKIIDITCGYHHSIFRSQNDIYASGYNRTCGLGLNLDFYTPDYVLYPHLVDFAFAHNVKNIVAGKYYTMILTKKGRLYRAGIVDHKDDKKNINQSPKTVRFFANDPVINHSGGDFHYICFTKSNKIYTIGNGDEGQLGHGDCHSYKYFKEIEFFENVKIKQVSCAFHYSYVLLQNGDLYSFGYNRYGQLGVTNYISQIRPIKVKEGVKYVYARCTSGFIIDNNDDLYVVGKNTNEELGLVNDRLLYPSPIIMKNNLFTNVITGTRVKFHFSDNVHVMLKYFERKRRFVDVVILL